MTKSQLLNMIAEAKIDPVIQFFRDNSIDRGYFRDIEEQDVVGKFYSKNRIRFSRAEVTTMFKKQDAAIHKLLEDVHNFFDEY